MKLLFYTIAYQIFMSSLLPNIEGAEDDPKPGSETLQVHTKRQWVKKWPKVTILKNKVCEAQELNIAAIVACENMEGFFSPISNGCYIYQGQNNTFQIMNSRCTKTTPPNRYYHKGTLARVSLKEETEAIDAVRKWADTKYGNKMYLNMRRCLAADANMSSGEFVDDNILKVNEWCLADASGNANKTASIKFEISANSTAYKIDENGQTKDCMEIDNSDNPTRLKQVACDKDNMAICQFEYDECASNPCQNGATCSDGINSFKCACAPGFSDVLCSTNIDECASNPCQNGGSCSDKVNGYACSCVAGYTDAECSTDFDECSSNPCENGATCVDQLNKYTCNCTAGFTDVLCSTNINECASNPCQNCATCNDRINEYTCTCMAGFTDVHCTTKINECSSNPCQNGATCDDKINHYVCICAPGYSGTLCDINIDECASTPCHHGANCTDKINGYTCTCNSGISSGTYCQTSFVSKFAYVGNCDSYLPGCKNYFDELPAPKDVNACACACSKTSGCVAVTYSAIQQQCGLLKSAYSAATEAANDGNVFEQTYAAAVKTQLTYYDNIICP